MCRTVGVLVGRLNSQESHNDLVDIIVLKMHVSMLFKECCTVEIPGYMCCWMHDTHILHDTIMFHRNVTNKSKNMQASNTEIQIVAFKFIILSSMFDHNGFQYLKSEIRILFRSTNSSLRPQS